MSRAKVDFWLVQNLINFVVIKFIFLICYFFFSLLFARKKRKRSNPEKEKSRARLEFVGILKQELKNILSLFLLQNSTILCRRYRAFQAHNRPRAIQAKGLSHCCTKNGKFKSFNQIKSVHWHRAQCFSGRKTRTCFLCAPFLLRQKKWGKKQK